ncbi:MAG: hypothetical protein COU98_02025 [Candidatus Staskawiczbacteria bacterium CG10_big_fil_rev_8_21_14_0_10_38_10]|uniref:HD domain-containing protein n=1 Tax=Candidatus Staskawiczbacteria bacterium CG10_big_fil_rev_8_21_14_0_10_38_10 TaxID=1974891 RepID=A0A2H9T123_9BACT|nr:MAG: hypothetical protein COU98_02025 [Candidatus Staskawiczbacteria bacterium CG10_big_fil_rev_8_21_14_0_10_38_10]
MKNILNFLVETGNLKRIKRKGITFYCVKEADSAVDHTFRTAMLAWILGVNKELNIEKTIKIALVHNLCKVYAGDITPYDGFLPKNKKKKDEFVKKWRRLSKPDKRKIFNEKIKKEKKSLEKLTSKLPKEIKREIRNLWLEYEMCKTPEGKFVNQLDMAENLLEAFECWRNDKKFPTRPWWEHADEVIDDPVILEFLKEIEKEELKYNKTVRTKRYEKKRKNQKRNDNRRGY